MHTLSLSRGAARIALGLALTIACAAACGRDVTGTGSSAFGVIKISKPSFQTTSTGGADVTALHVTISAVTTGAASASTKVIVDVPITNLDSIGGNGSGNGGDSKDTVGVFSVSFPVQGSGTTYSVGLTAMGSDGVVLYSGSGTFTSSDITLSNAVSVSIRPVYVGPGANAARVVISPRSRTLTAFSSQNNNFTFTAQAYDASNAPLPAALLNWSVGDTTIVAVDGNIGYVSAKNKRGTTTLTVTAQGAANPSDAVTVTVTFPPQAINVVSGQNQTATVGSRLSNAIVVKTVAQDGVPVGGVTVNFLPNNGGSASPATAVTASDGTASTQWTLGSAAGPQLMSVSSPSVPGTAGVNATATSIGGGPFTMTVTSAPSIGVHGQTAPITIFVTNATGAPVTGGTVSWSVFSGGGSVNPATSSIDGTGHASTDWTFGPTAGTQTISFSFGGSVALYATTATAAGVVVTPKPTSP